MIKIRCEKPHEIVEVLRQERQQKVIFCRDPDSSDVWWMLENGKVIAVDLNVVRQWSPYFDIDTESKGFTEYICRKAWSDVVKSPGRVLDLGESDGR